MTITTDPTIVTLETDYADAGWDPHFAEDARRNAARRIEAIPVRYANATVTVPDVADWVRTLVAEAVAAARGPAVPIKTGPSLLLLGPTGTGKTYLTYGALRALAVSGVNCHWKVTTAADAYAALRSRPKYDHEAEFDRLARVQLLVLDDLGAAQPTPWTEEINYRLINYRYERELPTVITSNVPTRRLGDNVGERVASRLIEMCTRVVLKGDDRRRINTDT